MSSTILKPMLVGPLRFALRITSRIREAVRRLYAHAALAADLTQPLPSSTIVLGNIFVRGTGNVRFGGNALLYPECHLETQAPAAIALGDDIVLSRGVHLVAWAGISIGPGCMIGEYTSIRDANHGRDEGASLRDSSHAARPVVLGKEVWVGRGVTILGGVTIGDCATIGANAVVTRDVAAHDVVAGVPAVSIKKR